METKTGPTLVRVAEQALDAFTLAGEALRSPEIASSRACELAGREELAAEILFTITGFHVYDESERADAIMALAAMGCPSAQAILDAEFTGAPAAREGGDGGK